MKRQFYGIKAHSDGSYRTETLFGKDYVVVPVIALVEGVIQGMMSEGPELALAEEFGRFPAGWNGRPVVMSHPVVNNAAVSANDPQILTEYQIGTIYNAKMIGNKLFLEAWIEAERAKSLNTNSANTFKALSEGAMIEVSTGYFAQLEETSGQYEKEDYIAIQRNVVPDHLAFLPEGTLGACSNKDGCGAPRINTQPNSTPLKVFSINLDHHDCGCGCGGKGTCGGHTMPAPAPTPTVNDQYADVEDYSYLTIEAGKIVRKKKTKEPEAYQSVANDANLDIGDRVEIIALRSVFTNSYPDGMLDFDAEKLIAAELRKQMRYTYVIGLTRSRVVYEHYDDDSGYYKTYQRTYTVNADGSVKLGDDVQEVVLTTNILPVVNEATPSAFAAQTQPASEGTQPKENQGTATMPEPTATAAPEVTTTQDQPVVHKVANEHGELEVVLNAQGVPTSFKLTPKANATPAPTAKAQTFEELLAHAAPEIQETVNSAMKLHAARKLEVITALEKTGRCTFTKEQLTAMSMDMLENLAQLAQIPTYAGQALPQANTEVQEFTPAPMVFEVISGGKTATEAA